MIDNIVFNFDQNINLLIDQADLCITRAGASSLAEISYLKNPLLQFHYQVLRIIIN